MVIQTRKTYVPLVTPRWTFARVQPTTRQRVDLGLRLEGLQPAGRLLPSKIHATMPLQISLTGAEGDVLYCTLLNVTQEAIRCYTDPILIVLSRDANHRKA